MTDKRDAKITPEITELCIKIVKQLWDSVSMGFGNGGVHFDKAFVKLDNKEQQDLLFNWLFDGEDPK